MTVRPPKSLFRVSYRMQRSDWVAMTVATTRSPLRRLVYEIAVLLLSIAVLALGVAGSFDGWFRTLANAFSMPMALLTVPLLLAGPVVLALRPQIGGLVAGMLYGHTPLAERDVVLDLTSDGIEGGADAIAAELGWSAVVALIETPEHLFIEVGPGEALIVPRRAVPNEDEYRNLRGFIRARTGLATR